MRRTWIFAWAWSIGVVLAAHGQSTYNALKVSQLPQCNVARQGRLLTVNDADPDCQTGSGTAGSQYALCVCDPVLGWQALTPGGGGGAPTGAAGGDLAGTYPNPTIAADSVALGTDTAGPYAGSASEAGPATSALSVTGFTASKCARFDVSGVLVAASGDCTSGDTSGIGGTLGTTADAITTASGTGGSTAQGSTVKVVSGNIILPASGQLAGTDNYVRIRCAAGDNACGVNIGPGAQDPQSWFLANSMGSTGQFLITGQAGSATSPVYTYTDDSDTGVARSAANTLSIITGGVQVMQVTVDRSKAMISVQVAGRTSPPYTCDASAEGGTYYDSEDHDFCDCKGAGPAWASRGAGACT